MHQSNQEIFKQTKIKKDYKKRFLKLDSTPHSSLFLTAVQHVDLLPPLTHPQPPRTPLPNSCRCEMRTENNTVGGTRRGLKNGGAKKTSAKLLLNSCMLALGLRRVGEGCRARLPQGFLKNTRPDSAFLSAGSACCSFSCHFFPSLFL